jgi:hypothetical protein
MKTFPRSLALATCVVGAVALAPGAALAAGGHSSGSGWHGGSGANFHGGGSFRGGHWGHRGFVRPGVFWGGLGLGLGIGAVGYYGGWWGPYAPAYAPYYSDGYYYDAAPAVIVSPGAATLVDPAPRSGQPVPQASRSPDPIFYPNKGQSAAAIESDRRECNRWATTQNGAMADASIFQRATFACMEGRGYTVR